MHTLNRAGEFLDGLTKTVTAFMVLLMSIIVLVQVWLRYVTKGSLPWSEEAARYLMIWLSFLAASRAFRQNRHIGMTVLVNLLPDNLRKAVWFCSRMLMAGLLLFLAYQSYVLLPGVSAETTPAMRISMAWAYLAIPVGLILLFIQVVIKAITDVTAAGNSE